MSKRNPRESSTHTKVSIAVETPTKKIRHKEPLTPTEEKVVRMLRGLGEPDHTRLEFAVGASEETRQKLALMETGNIVQFEGAVPIQKSNEEEARALIAQMIRRHNKPS